MLRRSSIVSWMSEHWAVTTSLQNWLLRNRPFLAYGPLILGMVSWAITRNHESSPIFVTLLAAGFATWTLLEWSAHRAMHWETGISWLTAFQDEAHLRHHREPDDLEHSVVRLSASLPLAALLYGVAWLIFRDSVRAALFHAGLASGYLFYEFVHLTAHAHHRLPGLRQLHRYHATHHFVDSGQAFGVTTRFWDHLFGTLPKQPARAVNKSGHKAN